MKNFFLPFVSAGVRRLPGRFVGLGLLGAGSLLLLSGCDPDGDSPRDNTAMLPADQQVSSVPWNKPQGWENKSQLGALANDPRIGGQQ